MTKTVEQQLSFLEDATVTPDKLHWSFWFGVAFFVLVIVGICSFSWFVNKRLSSDESSLVTSVVISGEMPYTNSNDIEQAIDAVNLGNFFRLDVDHIQQQVASLPWVYSVAVRKKWPNELKIYVVDQSPIAYWNGNFLINKSGKAFQANIARIEHALPAFFGPEGSEQLALQNFKDLNALLKFNNLSIDELVLSERFSWQLTLDDGVTLNLGRENRVERIQRFMDIYPEIKNNKKANQQIDYVDLRYDTGVAVGWKPLTDKERV